MSTHPITNGGGKYSYPVVPANPAALASAAAAAAAAAATTAAAAQQRPQQRTGPISAGATTSTTSTAAASTPRSAATSTAATSTPRSAATSTPNANAAAISNSNGSINKFHSAGRYANASLSILGAYAAPSSERGDSKRPRIADCVNLLERLVHPLFLCANNSSTITNSYEHYGDDREDGTGAKKRRGDGDRGSGENGDSDEGKDDVSSSKIDYQAQLRVELERCKQQNLLLVKRRENVFKSLVTLHELYETGLDGIARMNDLRLVPDNVMPDKMPK